MISDTIAAIATAMSDSGISIIRISGDHAISIADSVFSSANNKGKLEDKKTHTIHYGHIHNDGQIIDEVLVMLMRGPKSYTGEDTVEINCHGGVFVTRKILELVLNKGARIAEPGEFTKRAFLNGKMDLSQAEAVSDIISAKNEFALKSSVEQLNGSVLNKIKGLRDILLYEMAFIESALDDPEHISLDGYSDKLLVKVDEVLLEVEKLIRSFDNGKMKKEGIRTVIVGKPNAGKSSLLNVLIGEDKAIVTDVAGTTRDILEEYIQIDGIGLHIIDTAGIRNTSDIVEKIGVERALANIEKSDLILYVIDQSVDLDENDLEIIQHIKNKKVIILLNKSDLENRLSEDSMLLFENRPIISISAKDGLGIDQFYDVLKELFYSGTITFNDEFCITNERHKQALQDASQSLYQVKESLSLDMPEDFYSIDLMAAYQSLGLIIGESVEEDLVNEIFSKFCMGK